MTSAGSAPDTVIVCRPGQLREAAMVLSCFPAGIWPPLLVMEPPPSTEEEYARLYEAYRSMRNLRDEAVGTAAARRETVEKGSVEGWSNEEIDRRIEALTPFRLWVKRQRQMAHLLKELPLRKAIFLFEASERDMSVIEAVPFDRISDAREPLLGKDVEWATLQPEKPGEELLEHAWQIVRPGVAFPQSPHQAASDSISVMAGLYRAAQVGAVLRIRQSETAPPPFDIVPAAGAASTETVLVEAAEDASKLLAIHYALRQRATLCVTGTPDRGPIEKAREAIQSAQEKGAADPALLAAMEASVTAVVPADVIAAVGDARLTAFTAGVPYQFVKTAAADWSRKPIGLMTGDALLLASIELFGRPPKAAARFNMLFDTGFFQTPETDGVLQAMKTVSTFPLLLQGEAATNTALIEVGPAPLDLLYFNTHGTGQSIILRDMPLPAYKLLQRVTLQSHPLVFNNSCLSWTGVGREFILAGARGYLGTLWSVNAQQAATFAIAVTGRLISGEKPIADCLADTGADRLTERAYVFVGPACVRLRTEDASAASERERMRSAAGIMLQLIVRMSQGGTPLDSPVVKQVVEVLRANAQTLVAELDRHWPEPDADRINLMVDQLDVANRLPFDRENAESSAGICNRGRKALEGLNRSSQDNRQIRAALLQRCSHLARRMGKPQEAIDLLSLSAQERTDAGESAGAEYLEISDAYRELAQNEKALAAALRARDEFAKPGAEQSAKGAMTAAGRLAQLWRMAGKLDEASAATDEGYRAAVELDDLGEQAQFKMDACRIQIMRHNHPVAVTTAEEALSLARRAHDDDKEVSAYGTLTIALIHAGEWDRAGQNARDGLNAARQRNIPRQIADFYRDLANIAIGRGDLPAALERFWESADYFALTRDPVKIMSLMEQAGELAAALDNWKAAEQYLYLAARVMSALERKDCRTLCTIGVANIQKRVRKEGWKASRDSLWRISGALDRMVNQQGDAAPEQLVFLRDLVAACHDRAKGSIKKALDTAKRLDELSVKGFRLADFMSDR